MVVELLGELIGSVLGGALESLAIDSVKQANEKDHKYTRGVVGFLTGSEKYPGAAILGVSAAWRTGIGAVRYFGPRHVCDLVVEARPETLVGEKVTDRPMVTAAVVGSGWGEFDKPTRIRWQQLCQNTQTLTPMVIDAGAIDHFAELGETQRHAFWVLTPHAGELANLLTNLGQPTTRQFVESNPLETASLAAQQTGCLVLLKGNTTYLVEPDGNHRAIEGTSSHLATAGTGDVLAGILGVLLAKSANEKFALGKPMPKLIQLTEIAVRLHSEAARRAGEAGPVAAMDVVDELKALIAEIWKSSPNRSEQ